MFLLPGSIGLIFSVVGTKLNDTKAVPTVLMVVESFNELDAVASSKARRADSEPEPEPEPDPEIRAGDDEDTQSQVMLVAECATARQLGAVT